MPIPIAVGSIALCIWLLGQYGFTVFLLIPFAIGATAALIYRPVSGQDFAIVVLTILIAYLGIGVIGAALEIEGFVCMAMAVPLALPISIIAGLITFLIMKDDLRNSTTAVAIVGLCLLVTATSAFEASHKSRLEAHRVVTTIEVNAPIEKVWKNVIEFPPIYERPHGIMRLGFAYPTDATIVGSGVGAIRHCNFNTGPFVEPITAWEAPTHLAFDVSEQPPIMIETGLGRSFETKHLTYLRSQRGEFRLYEKDGHTIVEGTTWYTHDISPDWYWRIFSDAIIHQIHERVLDHIKEVSETN
ncbi:MAG: hypothetical protein JO314_08560 [Acidobacteria bacterium]|nr:hypothetical protein [Acidobacteriota bacterium]